VSLFAVMAGLLAGCGGGGSDSGGVTPPPVTNPPPPDPLAVTLVVPVTSVNLQASRTDPPPVRSLTLSITNLSPTQRATVGGSYSTNGLQSATLQANGSEVTLLLNFRDPLVAGPGTYTDTVTVHACFESPCVTHIAGSPRVITLTYTITEPAAAPRMTLQRDEVAADGFVLDPAQPTHVVDATFTSLGRFTGAYVSTSHTGAAVRQVSSTPPGSASGPTFPVRITLASPAELGPGSYTDTVSVRACLDAACLHELAGSPATITVRFHVSDTVSGPDGFRVRNVAARGNDILWDGSRQRLYVSIAANAPANAGSIGVLDPVAGAFTSFAPIGNDPGRMAMSADGQYLYVALRDAGSIQRLTLPDLVPDLTIPVGTHPANGSPLYVKEMHVSPVAPRTVAVVRTFSATSLGNEYDLAVFDDAAMRPATVGSDLPLVTTFQWETGARIFGVDSRTSGGSLAHIEVGAGGLLVTASQAGVTSFDHDAYLVNGRLYMQRGRVIDPLSFAQIGSFPLGAPVGTTVLAPDPDTRKAFFLGIASIRSFDLESRVPLASIWIPRADPSLLSTRMIRWGRDGLAVLNHLTGSPGIVLIDGPFVQP
jgi:hypothetical protein